MMHGVKTAPNRNKQVVHLKVLLLPEDPGYLVYEGEAA
jgi:hypothetical protein